MNRKLQITVVLSTVLLMLVAVGVALGTVALRARLEPDKKQWPKDPLPGPMISIDGQVYNLGEHNRYLKASIVLEADLGDEEHPRTKKEMDLLMEELRKRGHKLRDIIIREINARSFSDLNSPEGKSRVKKDLLSRLNEELSHGVLKRVMFTEFALQ